MLRHILFLSTIVLLGATLAACTSNPYDEFISLNDYEQLDEYDETGELYLVYVYLEECPACQDLLDDLLAFNDAHGDTYPILADDTTAEGTRPGSVSGVPTMFLMRSGEIVEGPVAGVEPIIELLDDVESGIYEN